MSGPPQINLNELYSIQDQKKKNRSICFNHILELCHRRIRTVTTYGGLNTFYEVPGFVVGYPLYNIKDCMEYVVNALRKNGFLVQILPPPHLYVIYISWDKTEVKTIKGPAAAGGNDNGSAGSGGPGSFFDGFRPKVITHQNKGSGPLRIL
jgi:Family of unknown function (DUF5759)